MTAYCLALAATPDDLAAAQRLRYSVFVEEMGSDGPLVDHAARREIDRFDPFFDHLILRDTSRPRDEQVIGAYRLARGDQVARAGAFYSESEFDLEPLRATGRRLLELGRSCLHPEYRGGVALHHLWSGLSEYIARHGIEILFGVASFRGTDPAPIAPTLSVLHHRHLAPPELRPRARPDGAVPMDALAFAKIDRVSAMRALPPLIKAYLRLGAWVGQDAYIDRVFNTTDVCMVCDIRAITEEQRARFDGLRA
ncbi:putative hemolysin [Palleronia aestuarii]|uniref:L-ornithine N(alpha)-acyltransferase n=1 Tax=Palleronia aestuarii TaxID=568105 RepID=A0A2W7NTG1_9RHOB|nr:GNAT family N-acyltransferase [Palleronia aestuarii]PZX19884.1 putative hemolysin [Palleronia aestuarii]